MVVCGDEVVFAAACNAVVADDVTADVDVAAVDDVVVAVGAVAATVVWVQQCWMRACTSPHTHLVLVVVTLRGNKLSWWYQKTTEGPNLIMGKLVCCQPWCWLQG